jgi:hypothetical protein
VARSRAISHIAVSVPPGTLTDEYRKLVLDFYGELLGWREIDALRLEDRFTLSVGPSSYVNVRERADAATYSGYEHFGVLVDSAAELDQVCAELRRAPEIGVEDTGTTEGGVRTLRFQHLLPVAIEVQYFPPR